MKALIVALGLLFAGSLSAAAGSGPMAAVSNPAVVQGAPAPAPVSAPTAAPVEKAPEPQMEEFKFPVLQTIGGMGLILCFIGAGYFGIKKFAPQYFTKHSSEKNLRILETLSVGDKRSISIVQVGGSRYLIGNTANQINLLTALPEKVSLVSEPEASLVETPKESAKRSASHFRKLFEVEKGRSAPKAANPLPDDLRSKMKQLREALERG